MKIKVEQFCALATSPSWQAWLYHYDTNLYRKFINKLQQSKGCTQNREIMREILNEINRIDGGEKLGPFLSKHYPHMLDTQNNTNIPRDDKVFEYFNPNILSFPRRMIFTGDNRMLTKLIREFTLDKIKYDSIIVGDKAYIEYLTEADKEIINSIPEKNWLISTYRLKSI